MVGLEKREAFVLALPQSARAEAKACSDLDRVLDDWVRDAHLCWPSISLSDQLFFEHVANHLRVDVPFAEAILQVRAGDLYLACACAEGDSMAIGIFEERYFRELKSLWPSFQDTGSTLDDVRQMLRQKLFVAREDGRPSVDDFSGRGDLRGWVRVVAGRMLLDLADRLPPDRPMEAVFFERLSTAPDLELDRFKAQYGAEFKAAFREAVDDLSARHRSLLRHAYVRDASVAEIGSLYGIHRATAARWVASARDQLVKNVRKCFAARLDISSGELDSVRSVIESTVNVTLERYFRQLEEAPK
ncbi:MAG: hypothetical protein NVSMB1_09420 [Polyangiales bacterium]